MPFKSKQNCRHKFKRSQYRPRNWREYDRALKRRGDITFLFEDNALKRWKQGHSGKRTPGGQIQYSDLAIQIMYTIRLLHNFPLRQLEGYMAFLMKLLKLNLQVPHYSTVSRRAPKLKIKTSIPETRDGEDLVVMVDSTGLKVMGEKEWMKYKHGTKRRRIWRKLHICIDGAGMILSSSLTTLHESDDSQINYLLGKVNGKIGKVLGDGGYTSGHIEKFLHGKRGEVEAEVVIPPGKGSVPSGEDSPTLRDNHIKRIAEIGKQSWQKESGYNARSKVENTFFRYKTMIGRKLKAKKFDTQMVETEIGCLLLNHFTKLGMPI